MLIESLERRRFFSVTAGFTEAVVTNQLTSPTAMDFAPDGRLFVAEQGGAIRIVKDGQLLQQPFLTLTTDSSGERGAIGLTLDPNFASNGFVYVYYTVPGTPAHNAIARFTANGDVAQSNVPAILFDVDPLSAASNHNGGALRFGQDGKLYVGVGENANPSNAQTLANVLGKVLRLNSDGTIPADNPFHSVATGNNRAIWALGLRNPFTLVVEPGSAKVYINDVGQSTWEEINPGVAGANYGWPIIEGKRTTETEPTDYRDPLYAYPHDGVVQAITGGTFYSPQTAPASPFPASMEGDYFFSDLGANWVKRFDPDTAQVFDFATALPARPVDLDVGPDGSLFVLSNLGTITRFTADAGTTPVGQTLELPPTADATVRDGKQGAKNFGRAKTLQASHSARLGRTREIYLAFDLSSVDTISKASLTLFGKAAGRKISAVDVGISSLEGAATLTESSVTFNAPPAATQGTSIDTVNVQRGKNQSYQLDLTSYLQAQKLAGATTLTLRFTASAANEGIVTFASKESRRNGPRLLVVP